MIVVAAFEAQTVVAGFDDVAMVSQAVEQRGGRSWRRRTPWAIHLDQKKLLPHFGEPGTWIRNPSREISRLCCVDRMSRHPISDIRFASVC